MNHLKRIGVALLCVSALVFLNNTNLWTRPGTAAPTWLAHAGVHQPYDLEGVENDTCTASRIHPPAHRLIDNTLASIQAAFDAGAQVVEFDVHPTTDGHFVVFHDWHLECRTDGRGVVREHTLAELRQLDVGYGYTADGGKSFPLRGLGVGLMPTLDEVLERFAQRRFFINVKSNDLEEGRLLAGVLAKLPLARRDQLTVYGADRPIAAVRDALPDARIVSHHSIKACLASYIAIGWSGWTPSTCRRTAVLVPINAAAFLWGWPQRFLERMNGVDAQVFVLGPYHGGFSSGVDSTQTLRELPDGYTGGIWTNRIEVLGPVAKTAP